MPPRIEPNPTTTTTTNNNKNPNNNGNGGRNLLTYCIPFPYPIATLTTTTISTTIPLAGVHHPPSRYLCSVCLGLMTTPTSGVSSSHHHFHPLCLQAYHHLHTFPNFQPTLNQPLNIEIGQWCLRQNRLPPPPPSPSQARKAARVHHLQTTNIQQPPPQQPPNLNNPSTTRCQLEEILINLRDSRTTVRENALTALAEYTNPNNRSYLCTTAVLDSVLTMFFSHCPSTTSTAVFLLLNLSTEANNSTRYKIAHHANSGLLVHLLDVFSDRRPGFATPKTRDEAVITLHNLALEVRNKTLMGSVSGLLSRLLDYWLLEGSTASERGRQIAGWTVKYLVTSSPENLVKLVMEEESVVGRVLEMASRKVEGSSKMRMLAFLVLGEMAGARVKEATMMIVKGGVMEELVWMLKEKDVEKWCLELMWRMCRGMSGWEFKEVATRAKARDALVVMREEWGKRGLEMAVGMLKVMNKRYKKWEMVRPVDALDAVAEVEEEGEEEGGDVGGSDVGSSSHN